MHFLNCLVTVKGGRLTVSIYYIVQPLFLLLKVEGKCRVHFHSFMLDVHSHIHEVKKSVVRDRASTKPQPFDPIPPVARSISNSSWLICFDEFQVNDDTLSLYSMQFILYKLCEVDICMLVTRIWLVLFCHWPFCVVSYNTLFC